MAKHEDITRRIDTNNSHSKCLRIEFFEGFELFEKNWLKTLNSSKDLNFLKKMGRKSLSGENNTNYSLYKYKAGEVKGFEFVS